MKLNLSRVNIITSQVPARRRRHRGQPQRHGAVSSDCVSRARHPSPSRGGWCCVKWITRSRWGSSSFSCCFSNPLFRSLFCFLNELLIRAVPVSTLAFRGSRQQGCARLPSTRGIRPRCLKRRRRVSTAVMTWRVCVWLRR